MRKQPPFLFQALFLVSILAGISAAVAQEPALDYETEVETLRDGIHGAQLAFDAENWAGSIAELDDKAIPAIANLKAMIQDPGATYQPGLLARELDVASAVIATITSDGSVPNWLNDLDVQFVALNTTAQELEGVSDSYKRISALATNAYMMTSELMLTLLTGEKDTDWTQADADRCLTWLTLETALLLVLEEYKPL